MPQQQTVAVPPIAAVVRTTSNDRNAETRDNSDARIIRPSTQTTTRRPVANLDRFKQAQSQPGVGFDAALSEIQTGRKQGHWIWYVFPQLSGLGVSRLSQTYGLADVDEATAYLRDPVLRGRLLTIAETVADQLRQGTGLARLMGGSVDALKVVSSMTLFGSVARATSPTEANGEYRRLADVAEEILAAAESEGYPRCRFTLARL